MLEHKCVSIAPIRSWRPARRKSLRRNNLPDSAMGGQSIPFRQSRTPPWWRKTGTGKPRCRLPAI